VRNVNTVEFLHFEESVLRRHCSLLLRSGEYQNVTVSESDYIFLQIAVHNSPEQEQIEWDLLRLVHDLNKLSLHDVLPLWHSD
jgi:hypothetical protein